MLKSSLIQAVTLKTGYTKKAVTECVEAMFLSMTEALSKKENITFIGFGTFKVKRREAREGRNPSNGETIQIPAKNVVKFKAGKLLKEQVN